MACPPAAAQTPDAGGNRLGQQDGAADLAMLTKKEDYRDPALEAVA